MNCNCEKHTINMGCCEPIMVWADTSDYYPKSETSSKTEIADALTAINDQIASATSGMATQEWVENQGYLTEHQSLSGYATEEYVQDYTYDKQTIDAKIAEGGIFDPTQYYNKTATNALLDEKLDVSDFQTYSGAVASELSGKASQSLVDVLSGQIQSISSSTSGDVTVISGDVITISGDVTSISNDLSAHTANTSIHVTTAQTSAWDAKQNALTAGSGISITNNVISVTGGTEGITSAQCQAQIDQSISGKTNQSDFSAHTANTSIHVTTAQTASWDAKSNFSGSYNDLTNKPTIPSIWSGTEAQWSQISGGTLDNNTIYLVY